MTKPIDKAISTVVPAEMGPLRQFLDSYVISPLRRMLDIHNEASWDVVTSTGDVDWDLNAAGNLFVNHTAGLTIDIAVASTVTLTALRPGRRFVLAIFNGSGGTLTPSFSTAFLTTLPVLGNGVLGAWTFVIKHPELTAVPETLIQTAII